MPCLAIGLITPALPAKQRLDGRFVFWLGTDRHVLAYPMGGLDAPWIKVGAFVKTADPRAARSASTTGPPRARPPCQARHWHTRAP